MLRLAACLAGAWGGGMRADPVDLQNPLPEEHVRESRDLLLLRAGGVDRSIEDGLYSQGIRAHEKLAESLRKHNEAGARLEAWSQQDPRNIVRLREVAGIASNDNVRAVLQRLRLSGGKPTLEAAPLGGPEGDVWRIQGNVVTRDDAFLGTRNDQPLVLGARGQASLRILPTPFAPNLILGSASNRTGEATIGTVIGGGGDLFLPNQVLSDYGVVAGGLDNRAGGDARFAEMPFATVGGGRGNTAENRHATIAGGLANLAAGNSSTVGGGQQNQATGDFTTIAGGFANSAQHRFATVAGGNTNAAVARAATVGGGELNFAGGALSVVAGGLHNRAIGERSVVPGGSLNVAEGRDSLAAGHAAQALHDGSFVWSDRDADRIFTSTGPNQFLIRAAGNVGIDDNAPVAKLTVGGGIAPSLSGTADLGLPDRRWRSLHLSGALDFESTGEVRIGGKSVLSPAEGGGWEMAATRIRFPDGTLQSTSATQLLARAEARWNGLLAEARATPPADAAPDLARRLDQMEKELRLRFAAEMEQQAAQVRNLAARVEAVSAWDGPALAREQTDQAALLATLRADLEHARASLASLPSTNTVLLAADLARLRQQVASVVEAGAKPQPAPPPPAPTVTPEALRQAVAELESRWQSLLAQEKARAEQALADSEQAREARMAADWTSWKAGWNSIAQGATNAWTEADARMRGQWEALLRDQQVAERRAWTNALAEAETRGARNWMETNRLVRAAQGRLDARVDGLEPRVLRTEEETRQLATSLAGLSAGQTGLVSRVATVESAVKAADPSALAKGLQECRQSLASLLARVEETEARSAAEDAKKILEDATASRTAITNLVTRLAEVEARVRAADTRGLAEGLDASRAAISNLVQRLAQAETRVQAADTRGLAEGLDASRAAISNLVQRLTQAETRVQAVDARFPAQGVEEGRKALAEMAARVTEVEATVRGMEPRALVTAVEEGRQAQSKMLARVTALEESRALLSSVEDGRKTQTELLGRVKTLEDSRVLVSAMEEARKTQSELLARVIALEATLQALPLPRLEQEAKEAARARESLAARANALETWKEGVTARVPAWEAQADAQAGLAKRLAEAESRLAGTAAALEADTAALRQLAQAHLSVSNRLEGVRADLAKPVDATAAAEADARLRALEAQLANLALAQAAATNRLAGEVQLARTAVEALRQKTEEITLPTRRAVEELARRPDPAPALQTLGSRVDAVEQAQRVLAKPAPPPPPLPPAPPAWERQGNAGTLAGRDFLGTTDETPLEFRVNNQAALRISAGPETPNLVGGHGDNSAPRRNGAVIGGGGAAGQPNTATGNHAVIAGGLGNESGLMASVGGGAGNQAAGASSVIGGGYSNRTAEAFALVSGGAQNEAGGRFATIGGGTLNRAGGSAAVIGGGRENQTAAEFATIPGGRDNLVKAAYGFAAGRRAKVLHAGALVWADSSDADAVSERPDQFLVRASGGVSLRTAADGLAGVELAPGGNAWSVLSTRAAKENFVPVDPEQVLQKVGEMPLGTWNLKSQDPAVRHLGPVAEDFHAAFGLGETPERIQTGDADGVALAAIQGLLRQNQRMEKELEALRAEVRALRERQP